MNSVTVIVLAFLATNVVGDPLLNGLRVTWGIPIFTPNAYDKIPRTRAEAEAQGWKQYSSCGDSDEYIGERWIGFDDKFGDYDPAVMPIYDVNGYIAGIQGAIPTDVMNGDKPWPTGDIVPPFGLDKELNMYILTAYFVDPDIICTSGRTEEEFQAQGTGDRVVLQYGDELMTIPASESDVSETSWSRGQCFVSMGQHYWYNVRNDMSCDEFWPMFMLYNRGQLTAFGWAYMGDLKSPRYEHPPSSVLGSFFPEDYPPCMNDIPNFSTLHIYLTDSPATNPC